MENLKLIESVEYADAGPDADFMEGWRRIMKKHVDIGCPEEVNIPQLLAKKLIDMQNGVIPNINRVMVTRELEKAEKEVVGMIAGIYPRFEAHKIFQDYTKPVAKRVSSVKNQGGVSNRDQRTALTSTVLLCEKHQFTGVVLAHIFADKGYVVTVAEDGDLALKMLAEDTYDIVLVNYELLKKDAVQLMVEHKKMTNSKNRKSKFICMLSDNSSHNKKNAKNAGYVALLKKPFNMAEFEEVKVTAAGGMTKLLAGFTGMLE